MIEIDAIETPAVLIDLDKVEQNISRFQLYCDKYDLPVRPHIKTHKLPYLAKKQIEAGAIGITCQKISEAEVMAANGLDDILITYNIIGESKVSRLVKLASQCKLSVVADNSVVVEHLSRGFARQPQPLEVLIECDTGAGRCGVQMHAELLTLAKQIHQIEGLTLGGVMTYPPMCEQSIVEKWLKAARDMLLENKLPCPRVSTGGTPNMWHVQEVPTATEHRAGTYIFYDKSLINAGVCGVDDCALTVLSTVVSKPTKHRAVIDAGSKSLTSDVLGLTGYGLIPDNPDVLIKGLSEEHGVLDLSQSNKSINIGDRVRIIPNHSCPVSNLVDRVYLVDP